MVIFQLLVITGHRQVISVRLMREKKINMVENILLYYYYYYYYFKTWCKIVSQLAFAGKAKEIF